MLSEDTQAIIKELQDLKDLMKKPITGIDLNPK